MSSIFDLIRELKNVIDICNSSQIPVEMFTDELPNECDSPKSSKCDTDKHTPVIIEQKETSIVVYITEEYAEMVINLAVNACNFTGRIKSNFSHGILQINDYENGSLQNTCKLKNRDNNLASNVVNAFNMMVDSSRGSKEMEYFGFNFNTRNDRDVIKTNITIRMTNEQLKRIREIIRSTKESEDYKMVTTVDYEEFLPLDEASSIAIAKTVFALLGGLNEETDVASRYSKMLTENYVNKINDQYI